MYKLILSLFSLLAAVMLSGGVGEKNNENTELKIASYNIRVPVDKAPNDWASRKDRLLKLLKEQDFHIFGTQECVPMQAQDLQKAGYKMIGVGRNADLSGEFSAIFYKENRLTCLETRTFWLSESPDVPGSRSWNTACPRICTYGIFLDKLTGKTFVFANTHLDHRSNDARVNGAKLIIERLAPLSKKYPVILTGDFNSSPDTEQIALLRKNFSDARDIAALKMPGPDMTFHGYKPAHPKRRHYPIDFIFVNTGITVKCFQVINDVNADGLHTSDHYPLRAVIKL